MDKPQEIIIISGATATGKTKYSIQLAQRYLATGEQVVIINFDSLIFYRELNIGTAKPTIKERSGIPHEMIDICSAKTPLNAFDYSKQALKLINQYQSQGYKIILVGGSGFYIRALVKGMYNSPTTPPEIKQEIEQLYRQHGIDKVRELLKKYDPQSFNDLHPNDHYRNIRALEHYYTHQSPISLEKSKFAQSDPYNFNNNPHQWEITHYYLTLEKEQHWKIIYRRAQEMIKQGLITEVQTLLSSGFTGKEKPLNAIGYKETQAFLHGQIKTQEELIEQIYISTRQLAKAQKTFFQKIKDKITITLNN